MDKEQIFALERPDPSLLKLYIIRSILFGPLFFIAIIPFVIRYRTLRYRFDEEGIHMRWGLIFRREINLTYSRIQDIHLRTGILQRWLGLADLMVQTASGSATPEMTIEGFHEFEAIQDFLYTRMRGYQKRGTPATGNPAPVAATGLEPSGLSPGANSDTEMAQLLSEIRDELRHTREAIERVSPPPAQPSPVTVPPPAQSIPGQPATPSRPVEIPPQVPTTTPGSEPHD